MNRHYDEAEKKRHDDNKCDGLPCCAYCLADWEEQNREELDREGYTTPRGDG